MDINSFERHMEDRTEAHQHVCVRQSTEVEPELEWLITGDKESNMDDTYSTSTM